MGSVIKVSVKNVYGIETVYPACPMAAGFARIAGTKTLTSQTLETIQAMGFDIEVEAPVIRFGR